MHDIVTGLDLQYRIVARCAVFVAISEYMKGVIKRRWGAKRVVLIPNPVDTDVFRPMKVSSEIRGFPILLFVGRPRPTKGIEVLINVMRVLRKRYPGSKLIVVGGENPKLVKLAKALRVEDNVMLLGEASIERLVELYNLCDIVITASYWESFCRPIIEGMSCGKPVVCRYVYANVEHVENSGAAIGFKSDDPYEIVNAIEKALENYDELSKNARKYALKFDSKVIAGKWLKLYKLLAENASKV